MSLRLEHVSYCYEEGTAMESLALQDISLTVNRDEVLAVIGATGSGKSTMIQLMNGLNRPSEGHVFYQGQDIFEEGFDRRLLRSRVGLVFQYPEYQLFEETVLKDICFGPKNQGLSGEEQTEKARRAMATVGLSRDYEERSPFDLSGGEKRRAAIAGVLAMDPEILILDEPTAGLDPEGREELLRELTDLRKTQGIGIVLVSHSMEDVARLADRIVILEKGRLIAEGAPRDIFANGDRLTEAGLSLPSVTAVMHRLKEMGLPVGTGALSVAEAEEEITGLFASLTGADLR